MQEIPQEKTIEKLRENACHTLENKLRGETGKQILVIKREKNQSSWRRGIIKNYSIDKNSGQVSIQTNEGFWDNDVYRSGNILENAYIDDIDQKIKQLPENKTAEALMDDDFKIKSIDIYTGDDVEVFEKTTKNLLENMYLLEDRCNNAEDSHAIFEMMELLKEADEMNLEECPWTFEIYRTEIIVSDRISELKKRYSSENYFGSE